VYSIFLLETVQTALSGADLYYWFVSGFGNMNHLASLYFAPFDTPIMGSVVSSCVQFFFVYRIWVLGKRKTWWLCIIICLCSIVSTTAAFMGAIYMQQNQAHGRFGEERILKIIAMTTFIATAVADVLIAGTMVYHLLRRRARDGHFSSHAIVSIVTLTVETNIMTTVVSVVTVLMVVLFPETNYYVCPSQILGKLYSNTLLVSLNNRISIRDASVVRGAVVQFPSGTCPSTSRSEATTDIVLMDMEKEKHENALRVRALGETESQDRVIIPGAASGATDIA